MKSSDADLIQQLKTLSDEDLATLLEFLGAHEPSPNAHLLDVLEASISLQQKPKDGRRH